MIVVTCSTIFSTAGCSLLRSAREKVVHDTTFIERTVTVRDTILKAAPAAVTYAVQVPCPELKQFTPVKKQFKHATLEMKVRGDSLQVDCKCDTAAIAAKLFDTHTKKEHSRTEVSTRIVEKKYVPAFVNFLAWSGGVFWILFLLGVFIKTIKPKIF